MESTVGDLLDFLKSQREETGSSAASNLATAVKKVFETVEGTKWRSVAVDLVDPDDYSRQFVEKSRLQKRTKDQYRSRFKKALALFREQDPEPIASRGVATRGAPAEARRAPTQEYHIPLLESQATATLKLPVDLRVSDAIRLGNFIKALAVDAPSEVDRLVGRASAT